MQISDSSSRILAGLLEARTGQQLTLNRRWRLETALAAILRERGIATLDELITILVMGKEPSLSQKVVEALLNNETYFFRDRAPFDLLQRHALPELAQRRQKSKRLRIWSAGCSSGEEPYTIAVVLKRDIRDLAGCDVRILATDIDTDVLTKAARGEFSGSAVDEIPKPFHSFFKTEENNGAIDKVVMHKDVKALITFKRLNLMGPWPFHGKFDAIFCRNVMIYFDAQTKATLVERFTQQLKPGGWLFIGHSESLIGSHPGLQLVGRTIYQRTA